MQETIQTLVMMDKEARELLSTIQTDLILKKDEILKNKDTVYKQYLERAQSRIDKIKSSAADEAEKLDNQSDLRFKRAEEELDAFYQAHRDEWITEVVRRCQE